jgi:phage portal protein BeeE
MTASMTEMTDISASREVRTIKLSLECLGISPVDKFSSVLDLSEAAEANSLSVLRDKHSGFGRRRDW